MLSKTLIKLISIEFYFKTILSRKGHKVFATEVINLVE